MGALLHRHRRLALGGLWLLFHYFFLEQGEFGPKIHPLEPWWLKLHGAFAFAAVWIFGLVWGAHVSRTWPGARRRWSGSLLTGAFAWLIVSGYLLYYVGNENARSVVSGLHWGIGLASPICFGLHRFRSRDRRANSAVATANANSRSSSALRTFERR
jgi:hypothetical protein